MKKTILTLTFSLLLGLVSCSNDETIIKDELVINENSTLAADISTDVAILNKGYIKNKNCPDSNLFTKQIEIINFDSSKQLDNVYMINGEEYVDNGSYNDEISNDGTYTSVNQYYIKESQKLQDQIKLEETEKTYSLSKGENFKYEKELENYIKTTYSYQQTLTASTYSNSVKGLKPKVKIKITCKLRWVPCLNTKWYNTSLFGEKCIEYYDCEASFDAEWDIFEKVDLTPLDKNISDNSLLLCAKVKEIKL
ncbi:hypothetical protein [Myroides odoratus]|uniref:hypothetical protein n=1 Tax=Myroides odoratus TaxID=256 RepID=UPI00333E5CE4